MYKVVCREVSSLLEPPLVKIPPSVLAACIHASNDFISGSTADNNLPRIMHPASLSPLSASQDSCLKVLAMTHRLLRSDGQALLLIQTVDEVGLVDVSIGPERDAPQGLFRVISTGDGLTWPGVETASFGLVSSSSSVRSVSNSRHDESLGSFVQTAIVTRKIILVPDVVADSRYNPLLDGQITTNIRHVGGNASQSVKKSYLAIPLKGRGGTVTGALVVVKSSSHSSSTAETSITDTSTFSGAVYQ